ncbi:MAG: sensor histidine kinase [Enterococcus gilvus]|uniref:sensor histidine kinase n=1 Tax=Enterococcus malodoratus TaxID=71451 RepID=UPI003FD24B3F
MRKIRLFPNGENLTSIIWMLFLIIPLIGLFPFDTVQKQFAGVLLFIFAWSYRNTLFQGEHFLYWLAIQYLISCFYMIDLGYIYLFMFPAWQLGFSKLAKRSFWIIYACQIGLMIFSLAMGTILNPNFDNAQSVMTITFGLFTAIAPLSGREFYRQQEQRKQLYQANLRMENIIKGEERNRIARELHDSLGQSLSVMTIKLELAQKLLEKKPDMVTEELVEIERISRSTLKTVREIVSDMRRKSVSEELIDSNQALTSAKIILTTENEDLVGLLNNTQQTEFSSILREAVTNIIRHSKATYCSISFKQNDNILEITISDNGIGPKNITQGNGLTGMGERIKKLHGTMVTLDQKGLLLRFSIPLEEEGND